MNIEENDDISLGVNRNFFELKNEMENEDFDFFQEDFQENEVIFYSQN
jgi:hypothetical protein